MFINSDVQVQKDLTLEQELFNLLEARGLTGEFPEEGPMGLRIKRKNYMVCGKDNQNNQDNSDFCGDCMDDCNDVCGAFCDDDCRSECCYS